jgi:hypothetical protein
MLSAYELWFDLHGIHIIHGILLIACVLIAIAVIDWWVGRKVKK